VIDHKARHSIEEFPKDLLGLFRQRGFLQSNIHQAHPSITDSVIYRKRRMPRAEAWMTSLFNVSLRPSEPTDQEISEALLGTWEVARRIHGPQKVVLRDLPIEGGDQPSETVRANHGINFEFLHFFCFLYRHVRVTSSMSYDGSGSGSNKFKGALSARISSAQASSSFSGRFTRVLTGYFFINFGSKG
jgi:hypothetical protein